MALSKDMKDNLISTVIVALVGIILKLLWSDIKGANTTVVNPSSLSLTVAPANYDELTYNVPTLPPSTVQSYGPSITAQQYQAEIMPIAGGPPYTGGCYSCAQNGVDNSPSSIGLNNPGTLSAPIQGPRIIGDITALIRRFIATA